MMVLKTGLTAVLIAIVFGAMHRQAVAETIVTKSFAYFAINGATAADLDRELATKGPLVSSTGNRHPGETQIRFGGSATYLEKPGNCRVKSAQISVKTKIFLPTWKNRNKADANLAIIWDALSSDIKRHEERHVEIAHQHASNLEQTLRNLPPEPSCKAMREKVAQMTDRAIVDHDKDQMRFDRSEAINFESRLSRLISSRRMANKAQ